MKMMSLKTPRNACVFPDSSRSPNVEGKFRATKGAAWNLETRYAYHSAACSLLIEILIT